jgi:hypothetical protein
VSQDSTILSQTPGISGDKFQICIPVDLEVIREEGEEKFEAGVQGGLRLNDRS